MTDHLPIHLPPGNDARPVVHALVRRLRTEGDPGRRWTVLEAAHVAGQGRLVLHTRVHLLMLAEAGRQRDVREGLGQLLRLAVLPLGHLTGKLPWGNTGRSDVSAFRAMEPKAEVAEMLRSVLSGDGRATV